MANITLKDGKWWKGTITFGYDLKKVAIVIAAIAAVAGIGFGLYWLAIGISKLAVWTWHGICWTAVGVWNIKWWILGTLLIALLVWALSKINWSKFQNTDKDEDKNKRSWWWILLPIILLLGSFFIFRSCDNDSKSQQISASATEVSTKTFNAAFDQVVIARAYLDGVQSGNTKAERALVGLKYVDGKPVKGQTFTGKTYDQAKEIVAKEWRELVLENLGDTRLTEHQMVAVTLFAMRNGKYGFQNSDFLKEVKAGNLKVAGDHMAIHMADGTKRDLQEEAKQYLWVLKNLWDGNISVEEIIDYPMFSYKRLSVDKMYDKNGNHNFSKEMLTVLKDGLKQTPREALEL